MKQHLLTTLLITVFTTMTPSLFAAESLNQALSDCANLKRDLKRLACYDQLAGKATSYSIEDLPQRDRTRSQTGLKEQNLVAATTDMKDPTAKFGLLDKNEDDLESISSYINGEFSGWKKGDILLLANGQQWEVIGTSSVYHKENNPKITIKRGLFGSFDLYVSGLNKSTKVKRVE